MSTVVSRTFRSTPQRDAHDTWTAIVDLLTQGRCGAKRDELMAVTGVASSVIADQASRDSAIIVTCEGPRTRIYCRYDEDAIDGADANEDPLGFDPLKAEWAVSLPCLTDDLAWVQDALKKRSARITARDAATNTISEENATTAGADMLVLDTKGFLGS
jgi:hypothetical protein